MAVSESEREYQREWAKKRKERDPDWYWRGHLRRKYGITPEEYEALLEKQGGVCGICGRSGHVERKFHVDHDHKTGTVRGLLCSNCNTGLGKLGDSLEGLELAAEYLRNVN